MKKFHQKISRRQFIRMAFLTSLLYAGTAYFPFLQCKEKKPKKSIDPGFEPSYLTLHKSGELKKRGQELWQIMSQCRLCPRQCNTDRLAGEEGFCRASAQLEVSSSQLHFGEEEQLVGRGGSGAIFFTNCGLRCVFCINWEVSHLGSGNPYSVDELARMMLTLQAKGAHNINLVTPTHYVPHIVLAVDKAAADGLRLPLVYNTCGWESKDTLRLLDGVIDIYLPDFKYASGAMASKYSAGAKSYPSITEQSILEMHRQVGVAKEASDGLMYRGLMIRHLVMPHNVGGTKEVVEWIANNLPKDTFLTLLSQYRPCYKAFDYPEIARRITRKEYQQAVDWARAAGLKNLQLQPRAWAIVE